MVLAGFILPLPSAITFLMSSSLMAWTSADFRSFISNFIILAIEAFGAPSAPWQDLQALANVACAALASAAMPAVAARITIVNIVNNTLIRRKPPFQFIAYFLPSVAGGGQPTRAPQTASWSPSRS